jgi:hypothetical protein
MIHAKMYKKDASYVELTFGASFSFKLRYSSSLLTSNNGQAGPQDPPPSQSVHLS